jgi:8-oxo-dGTP diphosphatase
MARPIRPSKLVDRNPVPSPNNRRSARILLVNELGEVLLIKFVIERHSLPFIFWATPGGGVDPNESDIDAARRELREELGLDIELLGPVHSSVSDFEHEGSVVRNTDVFFLGRWAGSTPELRFATDAERKAMKELKWWSIVELEQAAETIFPADLSRILLFQPFAS